MRGARKRGTPGRRAPVRRPGGPRGPALVAGLVMLVPVCFAVASSQSTTFLATPAASAVDLDFTPSFPSAGPEVTEEAAVPALADVVASAASPAAEVVVPAATPSPTQTNRLLGLATTTCAGLGRVNATDIARLARAAGFPDSQVAVAVAVAFAESAGYPTATNHNTNGSIDFGLWQINSVHGALLTTGSWCVPADNAAMAHTVWTRAGGSWTPWTTYNSGSYVAHLSVANQAAAEIGAPAAVANPTPAPETPTPDPGTPAPETPTPSPGTSAPSPETPAPETPALETPAPETPPPSTTPPAPATTPPPSSPATTPPPDTTPPAPPPEDVPEPAQTSATPSQEAAPSAEPVDAVSAEASDTAVG